MDKIKKLNRRLLPLLLLFLLGIAISIFSWPLSRPVSAANVTKRSLAIGSAIASNVTSYSFNFQPATSGAIQSLVFQACTTDTGSCVAPSGLSFSSASFGSLSGWTYSTAFSVDNTGGNNCTPAANELCAFRSQTGVESTTTIHQITFNNITNPSGNSCSNANCTFYVHITTYSATNYTSASLLDSGTVAASTTQVLSVNFSIQESLTFCVGATSVDNATSAVATCATMSGSSLNLGVSSSQYVSVSPVATTNGGDNNNAVAELSTNAANGASVSYNAVQQNGTNHQGTLRVVGAICTSANSNTDQCINAIGITKANITAGSEAFGMAISGINCSNVSAYSCNFAAGKFNLVPTLNYNCNGIAANQANSYTSDANLVSGTTNCAYAWDESGNSEVIASSSSVVGGEALILKFAATPSSVTPTGSYTAEASLVATPSF